MADLLVRADLGWVLEGKRPSKVDLARLGIVSPLIPSTVSVPVADYPL